MCVKCACFSVLFWVSFESYLVLFSVIWDVYCGLLHIWMSTPKLCAMCRFWWLLMRFRAKWRGKEHGIAWLRDVHWRGLMKKLKMEDASYEKAMRMELKRWRVQVHKGRRRLSARKGLERRSCEVKQGCRGELSTRYPNYRADTRSSGDDGVMMTWQFRLIKWRIKSEFYLKILKTWRIKKRVYLFYLS